MLRQTFRNHLFTPVCKFSTTGVNNYKVCIAGGAGGIGQSMALLFKMNKLVTELTLYDMVKHTPGIGVDISHVKSLSYCFGFTGEKSKEEAFGCSDLVMCSAGMPRKPGMSRDDLFKTNASIAQDVMCACIQYCPKAIIAVITNPVNSVVPMCAEILKKGKCYNPNKLFGVTTLDMVRTCTFIGQHDHIDPTNIKCPVIGGHSNTTIVPVISLSDPKFRGDEDDAKKLMHRVREAGTEVVKAKGGAGSATLSMAFAGHHFGDAILRALKGQINVVECAYVESNVIDAPFCATPLKLGKEGLQENLGLPALNCIEEKMLEKATPIIKKDCKKGIDFAKKS